MNVMNLMSNEMGIKHPDDVTAPEDIKPVGIRSYPANIERSESLRRAARAYTKELKHQMENIVAEVLSKIDAEKIEIIKGVRNPNTELKPKFKSQAAKMQELRIRLMNNPQYEELRKAHDDWSERAAAWTSHAARLRREFRVLESDLIHNGNA